MKATVYRFVDPAGQPIYIGCSLNLLTRMATHERERPWWGDVATVVCEHFDDHERALAREAELIASEAPRENIFGLPDGMTALRLRAKREASKRRAEENRRRHREWVESDEYRVTHMYRVPGGFSCANCGRTAEWAPKGSPVSERPCKGCGVKALVAGARVELHPVELERAA